MKRPAPLEDAFLALIRRHERIIHKVSAIYAQQEDRRDLASDIILQLWRAFPSYNATAKESTWLYRVALNTAITRQRNERRRPPVAASEEALPQLPDTADGDENFERLHAVFGGLPQLERALVLLYLEDRSHAEISEIMGISVSNVGTRLSRIREKLKRLVKQA